jgi:acylaminoacyl-peptidase
MKASTKDDESTNINLMVDRDTEEFHQYAAAAVDLSMVHLSGGVLSAIRSTRNWDLQERQSYLYRFFMKDETTTTLPPIQLDTNILSYLPSPSGEKTVVFKKEPQKQQQTSGGGGGDSGSPKTIVEVWDGSSLTRRIVLPENKHGKVIDDPTGFGSPVWSPNNNEEFVMYCAERKSRKTSPFWTTKSPKDNNDDGNNNNHRDSSTIRGGNFVLGEGQTEHWGERYHNQHPILDIYILNIETGRTERVENVPKSFDDDGTTSSPKDHDDDGDGITLGQPSWHPSGRAIAYTGWNSGLPKRFGLVYCRNRESKIFESNVNDLLRDLSGESDGCDDDDDDEDDEKATATEENFTCVSTNLPYARSPRYVTLDDGGETLLFLGSEVAFVSHDGCMALYKKDTTLTVQEVVPVISHPKEDGCKVLGMGFPGLFVGQLPLDCGLGKNYVIMTSLFGSVQRLLRVDCANGDVDLIGVPTLSEFSSHTLCALSPDGDLVFAATACDHPPRLFYVPSESLIQEATEEGKVTVDAQEIGAFAPIASSSFSQVQTSTELPYDVQIISITPPEIQGATSEPMQSILLLPKRVKKDTKVPLVVVPHGGPHSVSQSAFTPGFAYMASSYAVLFPNYRGSIGFGKAALESLLARIGTVDVEDVMASTRHAIENFPSIDGDRVGICGGSHGGFLTAHCTTQYPDFFKAGKKFLTVM